MSSKGFIGLIWLTRFKGSLDSKGHLAHKGAKGFVGLIRIKSHHWGILNIFGLNGVQRANVEKIYFFASISPDYNN